MRSGITLFLSAFLLCAGGAHAASLDKETCDRLEDEQEALEKTGLRATMAKGPEWAKANLAPGQLEQVRRLIELDEQVQFRCQGKPLVLLPSHVDAEPAASDDAPGADKDAAKDPAKDAAKPKDAKAPAAKTPDAKPDPAKKPATPAKAPAAKQASPAEAKPGNEAPKSEAVKVAKPKPAPKKKVDDAYKPPQPDPNQNPFGLQDPAKKSGP